MSTFLSITFSGLALAGVYFLCAAGLTLIFGLMDILNFAQGAFITLGAYAAYELSLHLPMSVGTVPIFLLAIVGAIIGGALAAGITEVVLIRPLYGRPMSQVLVTIGLDLAIVAEALRQDRFAFVGLIGSATKRARFLSQMRAAGMSEPALAKLVCPVGVPGVPGKEPAVIAACVAAQLLQAAAQPPRGES